MGSSLETALVFPLIILLITGFTVWPLDTARRSYVDFLDGVDEISRRSAYDSDVSCEELNTFVSGVSDNYRIIYGGIFDAAADEG